MAGDTKRVKTMKTRLVMVRKGRNRMEILWPCKARMYPEIEMRRRIVPNSFGSQFQNRPHANSAHIIPVMRPPKHRNHARMMVSL